MPVGFWRNVKFDKAQLADEYCRSFGLCVPAAMTEANRGFVHEFARYLESTARELVVTEIAEEFSRDALDKSNSTYCTAREVATKLGIAHCFCDPTTEERRQHANYRRSERGILAHAP